MARKKSKKVKQPFFKPLFSRIGYLWQTYIRPFFFTLLGLIVLIWLGAWLWLGGHIEASQKFITKQYHALTGQMGFKVETVLIEGRGFTDRKELQQAIGIKPGDPLLGFSLSEMRNRVEAISWVERARVERRFPSTLYVSLIEREPVAIWVRGVNDKRLIDREGHVLTKTQFEPFEALTEIYGEGADVAYHDLLTMLEAERDIFNRVRGAAYIQQRRWDLILQNTMRIQLPEKDVGLALATLAKTQENESILERDIAVIDLRQSGRIIIKNRQE